MRYTINASVAPDDDYDDIKVVTGLEHPILFMAGDIVEIKYPDKTVKYIAVRDNRECNGCDVSKINNEYAGMCLIRVPCGDGNSSCLCDNATVGLSLRIPDRILEDL
jgi:hypothetical protein